MKPGLTYDFFEGHRWARRLILLAATALCALAASTLHYSEDASDFLPLGTKEREEMSIYQGVAGAERIFVLFSNPGDADLTVEAIESYLEEVEAADSEHWCDALWEGVDMESIAGVLSFVYDNIPYFLLPGDIERMDSLLSTPGYVRSALDNDRKALLFPSSGLVTSAVANDPLGLFSPVVQRLQGSGTSMDFEMYRDRIFTPDMSRAVLMMDSPFGSSETRHNSSLVALLESAASRMQEDFPEVSVSITGGPVIAVGNASRIKKDSIVAISLSAVLIVILLVCSFKSLRNILLIFLSVGWGMLFALGGLALLSDKVSIIVIGISSVILGIAVNYPLHLIAHTSHRSDIRKAMGEIVPPLVIGNVTTVGAFLALVPLKSTALRDLGLFASLLLVGTILFVLFFLPHYVSARWQNAPEGRIIRRLASLSPEKSKTVVCAAAVLTLVLSYLSLDTGFDPDMSHINYMTESQRREMQYFEDLLTRDSTHTATSLYVYGKGKDIDEALSFADGAVAIIDSLEREGLVSKQNEASSFIACESRQKERLSLWRDFVVRHRLLLTDSLERAASDKGFTRSAFDKFTRHVEEADGLSPMGAEKFEALMSTVFKQNFTRAGDGSASYAVYALSVEPPFIQKVKDAIGANCFAVASMNAAMTSSLSDNFNYIGWVCSLIVFFFLWFSFGRIELAVISFLPMAVSWLWILGLMSSLGIRFNIVNVILATFIFGQGDDYTIFMTEGCQYEYSRRKSILHSYKSSIIQSAAIMFVGMGTLIVARHPAMKSLAEVTIIGMFSVVLMAYLIPLLLFGWLTTDSKGRPRDFPISLRTILGGAPKDPVSIVRSRYAYKGKEIERTVRRNLKARCREISLMDTKGASEVDFEDGGYGELALLLAITHPGARVVAHISDEDSRRIAEIAAEAIAGNIEFKN